MIRPYRKNIMGGGEEKVRFDVVSEDEQYYIESCYAFTTTALAVELHRQHGYRVRFNDNSDYIHKSWKIIEEVVLPKAALGFGLVPNLKNLGLLSPFNSENHLVNISYFVVHRKFCYSFYG